MTRSGKAWLEYEGMASIELPTKDALDLIAGTDTAAFAMDRHEKIIYWNAAAEKLLGWSADEVLGKACFSVLAGRDPFGNLYCMRDCAIVRTAVERRLARAVLHGGGQEEGRIAAREGPRPPAPVGGEKRHAASCT